jgi:2-C-methyl-D-erythritol 4-phosphate cytidylyltransferase / 2-C-methyl-D-erythritol 2,4-cyclodiphosphate synthase
MHVGVVLLAAGKSARFGRDKIRARLGGKPVWKWSYDTFRAYPLVSEIALVCSNVDEFRIAAPDCDHVVLGGSSRQESCRIGLGELRQTDLVLIHDAARPFVSSELIQRVVDAATAHRAAAPRVPVTDTLRSQNGEIVDRDSLFAMQTPQGAMLADLLDSHREATSEYTDDMALIQRLGIVPFWVEGDSRNFKLTTEDDLANGYDIHRFSNDPNRPLILGGVRFEGTGLEGHSDADALLHAVFDALAGAIGLGDIGVHFPPSEDRWRNCPSTKFLEWMREAAADRGWRIVNIDATVIAERPKVVPMAENIRQVIAEHLGCGMDQVSVKATTNEGLGSLGRSEGVAAYAVATVTEA